MSFSSTQTTTMELTTSHKNQLKIDSLDLDEGTQTGKIRCPLCGESSSFSVKRDKGGLLYKCFRAKCGVEGYVPTKISRSVLSIVAGERRSTDLPAENKIFKANKFMGSLQKIPRRIKNFLIKNYQISGTASKFYGFRYNLITQRLYLPIHNLWGMETGCVMKMVDGSEYDGPKTMNHWEIDDPVHLHFPPTTITDGGTVVVVEDILSASKISPIMRSCALLGTSMSNVQASFLATHFNKMVVLLDPDAVHVAAKISRKFGGMFTDGVVVRVLDQDPKDTQYDILERLLVRVEDKNIPLPIDSHCGC